MKEPIFPTCTGDDGQRIYLIAKETDDSTLTFKQAHQ